MGFYFRKGVRHGPFRLNFSKSGIGASIGVKAEIDPTGLSSYNLRLTPQVIRLDPKGKITRLWIGFSEGEELSRLKKALGI